ncbi:MAG: gliding motility-associated C-terminal domain-containing protein [Bacteroidetes bacterium]|nr:gliding motility-associated C-terminal domain-containing protein [Bacteroidota bacterium]
MLSSRFAPKSFRTALILLILSFGLWKSSFGQTVSYTAGNAQHTTLSQTQIIVTWTGAGGATGIAFNGGAPNLALWTVKINGTAVPVTGAVIGGFAVILTFDATAFNGVAFIKPGQTMTVAYAGGAGAGTVTAQPGGAAAPAMSDNSVNNWVFTCGTDLIFFNQGDYAPVDQCTPVVMNFHQFQYKVSLRYKNSSQFAARPILYAITWGDGTSNSVSPYQSDLLGVANATFIDPTGFLGSPGVVLTTRQTHNYPASLPTIPTNDCTWNVSVTPYVNAPLANCNTLTQTTLFATYDTDNANSGTLNFPFNPPGSGETTNQVCLGTNVNMKFTDQTVLNCRVAFEPTQPNDLVRNIRIVYGSQVWGAPSNIPDIRVTPPAGFGVPTTQVTNNDATGSFIFPGGSPASLGGPGWAPTGAGGIGVPDFNGVIQLATPVTAATATTYMGQITTTLTNNQAVGQRFYVRLDYWDVCNPYNSLSPTNPAPVSISNYVEIVTRPGPLTTSGLSICYTNPNSTAYNFSVGGTAPGMTAINWYNRNSLIPATMTGTITSSTASTTVTGVGTQFTTQLAVGMALYNAAGTSLVGTIASITNNTTLVLGANANVALAGTAFRAGAYLMSTGGSTNYSAGNYTSAKLAVGAPFTSNNPNGKYYSVWATQVVGGTNSCESVPIEVVIYQQPDISGSAVSAPVGSTSICNGTNGVSYTNATATPTKSIAASTATNGALINFPTEIFWSNNFPATVTITPTTGTPVSVNYNLATDPTPITTRNLSTVLRYQATTVSVISPNPAPNSVATYNIASQLCSTNPANLAVTVYGVSKGGTPAPASQTICETGAVANITLGGFQGTIQYWQKRINGAGGFVPDASLGVGATITPVIPIVGGLQTTYEYQAVVQNGPCASATSTTATVVVNPKPTTATIALGTGATTICKGGSTAIEIDMPPVGAGGGTPNYTIVYRANGVNQPAVNNYVSGADITVSPIVNTTYDLFSVTDSKGCTATTLVGSVTISVKAITAAISTNGATSLCPPPNSTTIKTTITDTNGNPLTTYTVNYKDNLGNNYSTGAGYVSGNAITVTNLPSPGLTYTLTSVTEDGIGCTSSSNTGSAVISVGAPISAATLSGGGNVCLNLPYNLSLSITGGVAPYTITVTPSVGAPFNVISPSAPASISVPTSAVGTIGYSASVIVDACGFSFLGAGGNPQNVTVNPLPTANNQTPTVCSTAAGGSTAVVDLTTLQNAINPGAVTLAWFTGYNAGTLVFSGPIATPTAATVTNAVSVYARVTDNVTGCVSPATVTYTVNPRPNAPTGATGSTYCSTGAPTAISVANPGAGLTIDWYANPAGGVVLAGGTATLSYTPPSAGTYYAETRNTATGCVSTARTAVVSTMDTQTTAANAGPNQPNICSSAASVTMAAVAVDNGGIGGWTVPGKIAYFQNFKNFADGTTSSAGIDGFSRDVSAATTFANQANTTGGYFEVRSNRFEANNTNGDLGGGAGNMGNVIWSSPVIDISGMASVQATVNLFNNSSGGQTLDGGLDADYAQVYYSVNGGAPTNFSTNGLVNSTTVPAFAFSGASVTATAFGAPLVPSAPNTLQIFVKISVNNPNERIAISNVVVKDPASSITFDNPNSPTAVVTNLPAPAAGAAAIATTLKWTAASALGVCPPTSSTTTVTINAAPLITAGQVPAVCSGLALGYKVLLTGGANTPGTLYSWPDPDGAGPATAGVAVPEANAVTINDVLTNTTGNNITVNYVITPTSGLGCVGAAQTVAVTVRPAPALVVPQTKTICSGQSVNYEILLSPANLPAGTMLSWPDPDGVGGPATAKTIAADPAGTKHITDILTNAGAAPMTVTYQVTPTSASGCVGATQSVVVTVNPLPAANTITGGGTVCSGSSILLYQVTPNAGSTYNWVVPPLFTKFGGGGPSDFFVLLQFPSVGTATLQMTETNSYGCVGSPNTLSINVASAPGALSITGQNPVCKNQTGVTYSVPAGSFTPTSTYNWTASGATIVSASSGVGLQTITVDFGLSGAASISVSEVSVSGCTGSPFTLNVVANDRPVMTSANSQSICSGDVTTLSFAATPPSTFNWKVTSITGSITAATTPVLAVGNTGSGDLSATFNGAAVLTNTSAAVGSVTFDVTPVATAAPNCQGTTQSVVITVNPRPAIPDQTATICSGSAFTITPANGTPTAATIVPLGTTYTWTAPIVTGGITGGTAMAVGQPSISQTLTNPTNTVQTATYTVTPTSGTSGLCVGPTFQVVVTVNPKPAVPNQTATICSGTVFTVTPTDGVPSAATIVPAGTTYTWPAPVVTGGITGASAQVTGVASISQTLTNPTNLPQTATYTVTPVAGTCTGSTFTVTVTVNPAPVIPNQTATICSGSAFTISPANGVPTAATIVPAGTSYAWGAPVVTGGITGGSAQVNQANISQTLTNPTNIPQTATYTVTPTSGAAGACVGATFTVTVTINPKPVIPAQTASICSGGTFTITPADGVPTAATIVPAGTLYTWLAPAVTGGITGGSAQAVGVASISQTLTNPTNVPQTATYTVTPTSGAAGSCVGSTFTVTITVNPVPVIPAQTATICSGGTFTVTPANGVPTGATIVPGGTTFTWTAPVVTGGITGGSAQAVGQPNISQTLTNPTNTAQTATYTVTPTSGAAGACVGATFTVTVTVSPMPAIQAQTASVCSGTAFTVSPANGVPTAATVVPAGTLYTWGAPIVTGGLTGGSAQSNQASISQTLTNPTNSVQTATYTVTPSSGGCAGTPFTVTVTVNPMPTVPAQTATICSGGTFTIAPANGVPTAATIVPAGTTYSWPAPVVTGGITGGSAQAGQVNISQTLTNPTNVSQIATYTVTPTAGTCVGSTFTVLVTVDPMPAIPAQTATVCSGATFNITPSNGVPTAATIVPAGTTYTWPAPVVTGGLTGSSGQAVGVATISQTLTNPTNSTQTATYTVTPVSGGCTGATFTVTVTVNPKPVIAAQTATICSGGTFTISPTDGVPTAATIVPAGTTYTWGAPIVTGGVTGASAQTNQANISQTLTNPTNVPQTVTYTVTPTSGAAGACVGATFTVTVTVNPKPVIPNQTAAICSGGTFTINPTDGVPTAATIVPGGTTYTWAAPVVTGGITGGSAQAGQANISQTLVNPTNTVQTATYTVTPTSGAAGACVGATFTVTVTVNPAPVIPDQTATICSGSAFSVIPANGGATIVPVGTLYTWTAPVVTGGLTGGSAQPTAQTSISQTLTNPTNAVQTATYTVTPVAGSCTGATFTITVTVNPLPAIPAQSATICSGSVFTVSPADGVPSSATIVPAGTTYTWPAPVVTGGITGGSAQAVGVASISQTLTNPTNTVQSATYTVTPVAGSCTGTAFTVVVTVNPMPTIPAQVASVCSGSAFTVTPSNGVPTAATIVPAGTTYTWTAPAVTGGMTGGSAQVVGVTSISQTLTNPTNVNQTATYNVTPTSTLGCVGTPFAITVTVNPKPVIPAQTSTICSGGTFTISPSDGVPTAATIVPAGTTYSWPNPVVTGGITGGSSQTGQANISQTLTNPTNTTQTATYTVTPTSGAAGACVGATFTVTVTVNPTPAIPNQTATICSGGTFTITPANSGATVVPLGTTYSWAAPVVTGGITGGSAQAGQINISQTLTNPTNTVQTATYTVTPTSGAAGSCVGAPFTVTVTVNPTPVIPNQVSTICSGSAFTVTPSNGGATIVPVGTLYTWTAPIVTGGLAGGSAQGVAQTSISQTLTNPTNTAQTATYTVTPVSGTCTGATFTITVTVNPMPAIPAQSATVCSGNAFTVTPVDGVPSSATIVPAGTLYTWPAPVVTGGITGGSAQAVGVASISQTLTNPTNTVQSATYTVTPVAGSCTGSTFTVVITVSPMPTIAAQTTSVCSGSAFTVTPTNGVPTAATIVPAGTTYTWTAPLVTGGITGGSAQAVGVSPISQTLTNPTNVNQTATYTVTPFAGGCTGPTFTVTVTVNPKPVIPAQTVSVCSGLPFTISPTDGVPTAATIVPAGTTYAWSAPVVTGGVTGGSSQTGQSNISQTLTNPTNVNQTATYTVTPTSGAAGACVGSTFTVTVTVNPVPVIPAQTATICSGGTFNVAPANSLPTTIVPAGTTYTWTAPVVTGGITGGSAQAVAQPNVSQTLVNPTNAVQTATYTVTPTSGAAGSCVGASFTLVVTVNPQPVIPAQSATICSGSTFTISPADGVPTSSTVVPAGTTYSWGVPIVTGGITGGSAQSGQASISQTLVNPTNAAQTATYTVTPTSGAAGNCVGANFTVVITVNPVPVAQALSSISRCSGQPINFNLQDIINNVAPFVGGNSVNSVFKYSVVADFPLDLSPAVFPGTYDRTVASAASITETFSNYSNHDVTLTYTVTPISVIGNCPGTPFTFKVVYHPEPVGSNFSEPNCNTVLNHSIQTQITNGLASVFTYTISQVPAAALVLPPDRTVASSNPITDSYVNLTGSPVVVTYTITAFNQAFPACVGSATFTYDVTISPKPTGVSDTKPAVCSDVSFSVDPQANIVPAVNSTFTWTATYDGSPIPGGTGLLTGSFTNTSNNSKDAVYTITPTAVGSGCVGPTFTITIPINPEPVMDPALANPPAVCSTNAVSTNAINVVLGTNGVSVQASSFTVTLKSQDAGLTGTPTTGTFPAAGGFSNAIMNDTYRNTTAAQLKVVYTVVPKSAAGCNGDAFDITVLINPEPVVSVPPNTVCTTISSNIILATNGTSVGAASYKLINVTVPGTITADPGNTAVGTTSGINLIKNDKYTNNTAAPVTVVYEIRAISAAGCTGESAFINLIINPGPVLDPALSPTPVCSGVASGVTLGVAAGSVAAASYNINSVVFPGLTAGPSNQGIGTGKPANYIFNDSYINVTNNPLTATYSITAVSAAGCAGPTGTVILTINPAPDLANNLNKTVCSGGAAGISLAIANSVAMGDYTLNSVTKAPALVAAGGNATPGAGKASNALAADVFTNPTTGVLTVIYNISPRSSANCFGPAEDVVLSVEPTISAAPVNNKPSICSNSGSTSDPTDIVLASPSVPSAGVITFNYTAALTSGSNTTGFIAAGLTNLAQNYHIQDNLINSSNAVSVVTYTITPVAAGARGGLGCIGTPVTVSVTIEPKPKLVAAPTVKTVCEGVATGIALSSPTIPSVGGVQFLLVSAVATGGVTGASPNGTIFANPSTLNDVLSNPSTTVQSVTYTLRPRMTGGAGCIGDDVTVTINVNPRPTITATPQAPICSGDQIDISLTADVANTVSTWTVSAPGTVTGASPGAGDRIFQVLFNSGNIVETVTYTITPQASGCSGTPLIVAVQVSPKAKIIGVPTTTTVCHGGTLNVPLSSNVAAGVTYDWTVDDPNGLGVPATGSGNVINQVMNNTLGFQATLTYTITPTGPGPGAGCVGESKIMIVTVAPQITAAWLNSPSPDYICKGNTEYLIFQFGGQAPFDFTYTEGSTPITVTKKGNVAVIARPNMTATTTFTITSVKDALGCTTAFNVPFTVNVGDTDPTFSIISPAATCSPNNVSFQYNQVAGTIYTWRFGDSADSVFTATTTVPNKVIKHTYVNLSPTSTLNYPVSLQTELPAPFPGCVKSSSPKTVTIYPQIIPNVLSDKTEICSGESVLFMNQSVGATSQTWSYRVQGQTAETAMGTTLNLSYVFTNTTTSNPITYEVIYRGTNGNCPTPDQILPIMVYRSATAGFNEGTVPLFINGQSNVNFTNTTVPVDGTAFTYDWDFGSDSQPQTFTGTTPPTVKYVRPGPKVVTLTVTNTQRTLCKSEFQKTIQIDVPPLVAEFVASPTESCYPSTIKIVSSNITGDVVDWRVYDNNGRVVATSTGFQPSFPIPAEGKYTITLKTSNSMTGQVAIAPNQTVTVYGKPFASFDARPDVVYVPDTELSTFNFSTDANQWLWDFGDGATSTDEEPKHTYKIEGIYDITLYAQYDHGNNLVCADTLKHQVVAKQGGITKVPNAFTPNPAGPSGGVSGGGGAGAGGTGTFNDVFLPIVKGAEEFNLQIYDRWGNLIFESNDQNVGWDGYNQDGRILPAGVYVYKLTIRLSDGQRSTQIGDVTMIR